MPAAEGSAQPLPHEVGSALRPPRVPVPSSHPPSLPLVQEVELCVTLCLPLSYTPRTACVLFSVVTYEEPGFLWGPHSFLLV